MYKKSFLICGIFLIIICVLSVQTALFLRNTPSREYGYLILLDRNETILTRKWYSDGYMVPYTWPLDTKLIESILKTEDTRFYDHIGFDIYGKLSSIYDNIRSERIIRGGSTITEQYIKNVYFPNSERNLMQKVQEWWSAIILESMLNKEEILRKYLDNIYFWNRTYGIQAAIERYFPGKNIWSLNDDEILELITRIKYPHVERESPETIKKYKQTIQNKTWIYSEYSDIWKVWNTVQYINSYPILTERIEEELRKYCPQQENSLEKFLKFAPNQSYCSSRNIRLTLSIDRWVMEYWHTILEKNIQKIEKENVSGWAIYIYDGEREKVLAYITWRDSSWETQSIDMIRRKRSVGSILKPFIYFMALQRWWEIDSLILDSDASYPTDQANKVFTPLNYIPRSYGPITLREALGNSLNASAVRISEYIWIGAIYDFFRYVGLELDHDAGYYWYGIALWTVELTLENIVESYSFFLVDNDPDRFLIWKILSDGKNRARTFGVSSILWTSIPLAVKTGTSTDFRDNWVISYHKDAIIGVWVGNPDASPMQDVSGISGAGPIWHSMAEYLIERWIIREYTEDIPAWVYRGYTCIDTSCIRRESTWKKYNTEQKSRPAQKLYFQEDFIGNLSSEEKLKWNIR